MTNLENERKTNKKLVILVMLLIAIVGLTVLGIKYFSNMEENKEDEVVIVDKDKDKDKPEEKEDEVIQAEPKSEEEAKVREVKEAMSEHQYFEALFAVKNMPESTEKQELTKELETMKPEIAKKDKVNLEVYQAKEGEAFFFTYWSRENAEESMKREYETLLAEKAESSENDSWGYVSDRGVIGAKYSEIGGWKILVKEGKNGQVLYEGVITDTDGIPILSDRVDFDN